MNTLQITLICLQQTHKAVICKAIIYEATIHKAMIHEALILKTIILKTIRLQPAARSLLLNSLA